ncbi:hypothetical protein [Haloferula sp. BvORR071]|uniref:hypothetical protein n=1 Tax=Haloferula sp. BvORR071 TaxID=1396141 RepID=UPI00054D3433|nr:hypothetical protein [Haloferula sp. BvORR071]
MRLLLFAIIAAAILLGFQQGRESLRLAAQEKELSAIGKTRAGETSGEASTLATSGSAVAAKIERQAQGKFNATAYIAKCRALILMAMVREPNFGEDDFVQHDLLDATTEDLLQLLDQLHESGIPEEFWSLIYESASPRLLDKDPLRACEFSMKGGDIENFTLVVRSWIARDPQAAGEWLKMKTQAEPPLNEKTFRTYYSHPEELYVPGLQLAASIAAAPATADLEVLTKLDGSKLKASLDDLLHVLPPDRLPLLLKRLAECGREDLVEMAIKQHPEPALAREYLTSASLPPATFTRAAELALSELQPGDLPGAMKWYLKATDPALRGEGLQRIVSSWTQENPHSAAAWIEQLPEGADRKLAKEAYEDARAHPPPKKARPW